MTIRVLSSLSDIDTAREKMKQEGISCHTSFPIKVLRKLGVLPGVNTGEHIKSWDVYQAVSFIREHLPKDAPVLDIGAYASEILCSLHKLQYTQLTGVDLNERITAMPNAGAIRYVVSDFTKTPFPEGAFQAITAISVIEHGFKPKLLLSEIARLLRPGGFFIASLDYWPTKIDTTGITLFGMDWRIFSQEEVSAFVDEARAYGFELAGPSDLSAPQPVIKWGGKDYTFALVVLKKSAAVGTPTAK